jgi:hypothetical protein
VTNVRIEIQAGLFYYLKERVVSVGSIIDLKIAGDRPSVQTNRSENQISTWTGSISTWNADF